MEAKPGTTMAKTPDKQRRHRLAVQPADAYVYAARQLTLMEERGSYKGHSGLMSGERQGPGPAGLR